MTVYDGNVPGVREYTFMRLAMFAKGRRANRPMVDSTRINAVAIGTIRVVLHVVGFALLTWSGFQWNMIAGGVIAALSCFVMSTLLSGGNSNGGNERG
jgi:fatty acid desaturase